MAEPSGCDRGDGTGVPVDPEWYGTRIGWLTAVGLLIGENDNLWGVLFQCDCGRPNGFVKVPLRQIRRNRVPPKCYLCRPKKKRKPRRMRARALLKTQYPSEYKAWLRLKHHKVRPRRWDKFKTFMRDVGPCPPGWILRRRDPSKPHGKGNTHWEYRLKNVKPLFLNGEPVSTGSLKRGYGIRKSFTGYYRRQGVTDAAEIIRRWNARNDTGNQGDLPDGRPPSVSSGEGDPTQSSGALEG